MYIFLAILIVIACVLLIGVVLIQKSKGGGLASDYSGGNQYLGYRKTTDFVEKATWSLAIFVCVISIFASFAIRGNSFTHSAIESVPAQAPQTETPAAQPAAPATPAAETPATPADAPEATSEAAATEATPEATETKAEATETAEKTADEAQTETPAADAQ